MRTVTISFLTLFFILAGCSKDISESSSCRIPTSGRNVILIIIDTLRSDHLSCYGYSRNTSSTIDSLAGAGTMWLSAQSQAPWTLPSHASIWTGLSVKSHGTTHIGGIDGYDLGLDTDIPSLPSILRESGLQTSGFTNFFLLSKSFGFDHGFDWYDCDDSGSRTAAATTDAFLYWLDNKADNRNFFSVIHLYDVHSPYSPAPPFDTAFCPEGVNGTTRWDLTDEGDLLNPEDLQHLTDMYDSEILYVDSELSRLFAELKNRGITGNTLIVITSDHGEEFLEHGGTGHGHALYNEQILIPMIFAGPEIADGIVSPVPVASYDIMPTIISYLGADVQTS
jgi:arylsulfatase A-like enzyme